MQANDQEGADPRHHQHEHHGEQGDGPAAPSRVLHRDERGDCGPPVPGTRAGARTGARAGARAGA